MGGGAVVVLDGRVRVMMTHVTSRRMRELRIGAQVRVFQVDGTGVLSECRIWKGVKEWGYLCIGDMMTQHKKYCQLGRYGKCMS